MERFFKKVWQYQKSVAEGYGNAVVEVQADADGISDIMINGIEGLGWWRWLKGLKSSICYW